MSNICVIGVGYVGLVTGACLADLGNQVFCLDIDREKCQNLKKGIIPIFEPGLEEMVNRNYRAGRLDFTSSYSQAMEAAEFIFIAVGTPSGMEGEANLSYVEAAAQGIAEHARGDIVVVNKSTVPIGSGDRVASIIKQCGANITKCSVVSNPEFLREGTAVSDFMRPDRVVLGATDREAAERLAELYAPLDAPVLITDLRTAEMIKYASNAFLATRISFINEIAAMCEALGADVKAVARGMGYDKRIGHHYLDAGIGWGGSCFPKDVSALIDMGSRYGCYPRLLRAVAEINKDQRRLAVQKMREALGGLDGKTVGVLGLSFKPGTDDMRDAPAREIIHFLQVEHARVKAYDPAAMRAAAQLLPDVELCENPYEVAKDSDALAVLTEWNEFKHLNMARIKSLLRSPVLFDGRNIYDPKELEKLGFMYRGIGR
ncbi:MAG: UDP-glucose/GDP-mannose dehydrogenase family protein [Bacteroidetes bacterium]|nr:UDP-glucose/GDP-mannose dehydrogenase family protein [Bacteroidota bacterium]MCL5026914.1 UDP-glucose/GDP-mannose dehydrogenase family protein [Chloroflexota bacterium]